MQNIIRSLNKPEYLYQPTKTLHRIFGKNQTGSGVRIVVLPWKLPLEVNCGETIGRTISHHGLFELSVVEAIFRLVDPSDIFLDVGANIGYMASVAVSAAAKKVISFEPHPDLFAHLSRNVGLWIEARPEIANRIETRQIAVSSKVGTAILHIPGRDFMGNEGISSLETRAEQDADRQVEVATTTLDRIIEDLGGAVGVLKIDIEGHELHAFEGALESLASHKIRDIIFEDHEGMTSEVSRLLSRFGYSVFGLNKTLFGPMLLESLESVERFRLRSYEGSPNFLATLDPERARLRMASRGYKCLGARSASRID
jgi:FkbM family methyltransferase